VGTANFVNPQALETILADLEEFCITEGIDDINQIIGTLEI